MIFNYLFVLLIFSSSAGNKYRKAKRVVDPLKAVEYYRQIVNEEPDSPYADSSLFRIGMFYYLIGDYKQAIEAFKIIYKKGNSSSLYKKSYKWLKFSYLNHGDTLNAKKFEKMISKTSQEQNLKIISEEKKLKRTGSGIYTVQLGAYRDRKWADLFHKKLSKKNIESFLIKKDKFLKVCSGKFSSQAKSERWLEKLKEKGFDGFIIELNSSP